MSTSDNRRALISLIDNQQLYPLSQPVVDTTRGCVIGHESLIRGPKGHVLEFPDKLFSVAHESDLLSELELACRYAAIKKFQRRGMTGKLFLNVNPNVLKDDSHPHGSTLRLSQQLGLDPHQIVIEISERYPIEDTENLKEAIIHYRQLGFMIAIDDLGAGYSGLKLWSELHPDYVKIDRYFIQDIHESSVKRVFVQSILSLAKNIQTKVIAEGIETKDELEQLHALGIKHCQGYLFGRPAKLPARDVNTSLLNTYQPTKSSYHETIASVVNSLETIADDEPALEALNRFTKNASLSLLPVTRYQQVVGVLRREKLLERFSGSYGHALNASKHVVHIMEKEPIAVDWRASLEDVSQLITEHEETDVYQHIIVTRNNRYYGVASIKSLLRKITELKINDARHANPLTQLPGNVAINRVINEKLKAQTPFSVAYFDLNHFKPYNDIYGYEQGDQVIKWVAQLLQKHLTGCSNFVGHIGGDDFVVIFDLSAGNAGLVDNSCKNVIELFDRDIIQFYHEEHIKLGGIKAVNREGHPTFFSLLSIAVGVVSPDAKLCESHHDVALLATEAKKEAKRFGGSHCYLCHRQAPRRLKLVSSHS